ncbi:hypothetical protein ACSNN7_12935 [Micromonospora sp. URMC 105]
MKATQRRLWTALAGEWHGYHKTGVYLKVCTSDANTNRTCGYWL